MQKPLFCGKCGNALDKETGKCPVCDKPKVSDTKVKKKNKKANSSKKKRSKGLSALYLILVILVVIGGAVIGIIAVNNAMSKNESGFDPDEIVDADNYYSQNAEVVSEISAQESIVITTASETYSLLKERGFRDFTVTASYDMNGEYLSEAEVSKDSEEKYPMYTVFYYAESGEVWIINVINGTLTAYPVTYNQQTGSETEVIIAESDTIMTYDGPLNKFYETKPHDSAITVKRVSLITAESLENLGVEEIDKL